MWGGVRSRNFGFNLAISFTTWGVGYGMKSHYTDLGKRVVGWGFLRFLLLILLSHSQSDVHGGASLLTFGPHLAVSLQEWVFSWRNLLFIPIMVSDSQSELLVGVRLPTFGPNFPISLPDWGVRLPSFSHSLSYYITDIAFWLSHSQNKVNQCVVWTGFPI